MGAEQSLRTHPVRCDVHTLSKKLFLNLGLVYGRTYKITSLSTTGTNTFPVKMFDISLTLV